MHLWRLLLGKECMIGKSVLSLSWGQNGINLCVNWKDIHKNFYFYFYLFFNRTRKLYEVHDTVHRSAETRIGNITSICQKITNNVHRRTTKYSEGILLLKALLCQGISTKVYFSVDMNERAKLNSSQISPFLYPLSARQPFYDRWYLYSFFFFPLLFT